MLNKSGANVILFPIGYEVSCGSVIYGLNCVEVHSLYFNLAETFYRKRVLNFVKCPFYLLILERERDRKRNIDLLLHSLVVFTCALTENEPETLAYWDGTGQRSHPTKAHLCFLHVLICVCIMFTDLKILNQLCILGINPTWSLKNPLNVLLNLGC